MKVYLDYAATTPVKPEVLEAMTPYFESSFGNPSSVHAWGQEAKKAVDGARVRIADFLNAEKSEIIFTGSGSEADNLAIKGLVLPFIYQKKMKPHIITSAIEHHAVLRSAEALEQNGAEVTYIKPNKEGVVEVESVKNAIQDNTVLVSIMYVNNEIGTVQPIREIGKIIESLNEKRPAEKRIYFHTDAIQATEFLPMDVKFLHVDMLSVSGHKIGVPKGIGLLYVKKGTPLIPMIHGGEQEGGLRAGTENVAYIAGMGKSIELIQKSGESDVKKVKELQDYFIDKALKEIPEIELNGSRTERAPHIANFYFKYIEGESVIIRMDLEGAACSTGSACNSLALEPSHVISSIYNDPFRSSGSVRFSFGPDTSREEVDFVIEKLKKIVESLRLMSPFYKEKGK